MRDLKKIYAEGQISQAVVKEALDYFSKAMNDAGVLLSCWEPGSSAAWAKFVQSVEYKEAMSMPEWLLENKERVEKAVKKNA